LEREKQPFSINSWRNL